MPNVSSLSNETNPPVLLEVMTGAQTTASPDSHVHLTLIVLLPNRQAILMQDSDLFARILKTALDQIDFESKNEKSVKSTDFIHFVLHLVVDRSCPKC